ncbi:ABC transporter permease [Microbacterium sp. RD1]|uniref:ABC transporter permease n=1 Tax=Microbacterium sp. RD1 TaxID=3457313 RepID=UPI003FA53E9B
MNAALTLLGRYPWSFAAVFVVIAIALNIVVLPSVAAVGQIPSTLAAFAPFALLGMASAPSILSGHGGLDLSVAPTMGLINILLVTGIVGGPLASPAVALPVCLLIGLAIGTINGLAVAVLRFPAVIATLCMFFVLSGLSLLLVPTPLTAPPNWTDALATTFGPIPGAALTIGAPLLLWGALRATGYTRVLLAVGDNEVAAYTSGVPVWAVRVSAYALGGLLAAAAGIALTGLVRTADANLSGPYVLVALAAVAIGGVSLAGGSGGMLGPLLGAASIYLLSLLLTSMRVSAEWVNVAYGAALLLAVVGNAALSSTRRRTT